MYPTLNIGNLVFPTSGLVIIVGAWLSLSLVEWAADRTKQNRELIYGVAATAVFVGFIGARLTFVVRFWPAFSNNLLNIVWPLNSGYEVWGGVLLGLAGGFFYARAKQLQPVTVLDAIVPGLVLGLMVVSLADFLGGPGYGSLTAVPWGITQFGVRRHPVQVYELVVGSVALFIWWRTSRPASYVWGRPFLVTVAAYSAGRLFVDAFRENAMVVGDGYHLVQIVTLLIVLACLFQMSRLADGVPET